MAKGKPSQEVYLRGTTWHIRFQMNGVKVAESTHTSNRREADRYLAKRKSETHEEVILKGKTPVNLHKIIDEYVASRAHLASADNCRTRLAYFKAIPNKAFHKVTDKEPIEIIEAKLAEGAALSTMGVTAAYWNSLVKYADAKGYSVPSMMPSIKGIKGKLRWLTVEEEQALLAALSYDKPYSGKTADRDDMRQANKDFIGLLLDTGARYKEIALMDWNQVDFNAGTVTIHRQKGGTDTVMRMTNRMKEILERRHAAKTNSKIIRRPKNEQNWWDAAVDRAKLSDSPSKPTLHSLRHTYASRLIRSGAVSLPELQNLLGHRDIKSTMVYAHFFPSDATSKAADALNKLQAAPIAAPTAAQVEAVGAQVLRLVG